MRLVILESPYAATTPEAIARNVAYARAAMRDCLMRGEAPYASHLLYTQPSVLRDEDRAERSLGMKAGFAWHEAAEASVAYIDFGISPGMKTGMDRASKLGKPVETRRLEPAVVAAIVAAHPMTP
jgi:hypothetical protein